MNFRKSILAMTAAATLSACAAPIIETKPVHLTNTQIKNIQSTVANRMKDPSSAQFRNIRSVEQTREDGTITNQTCGEVNAKNSFGGYVGFTTFTGHIANGNFNLFTVADPDSNWLYAGACAGA